MRGGGIGRLIFLTDEIFLKGFPLVGLQVSASFLHPQVCWRILLWQLFLPLSLLSGSLSKSWRRASCMWPSSQTSGTRTSKPPPCSQVPSCVIMQLNIIPQYMPFSDSSDEIDLHIDQDWLCLWFLKFLTWLPIPGIIWLWPRSLTPLKSLPEYWSSLPYCSTITQATELCQWTL